MKAAMNGGRRMAGALLGMLATVVAAAPVAFEPVPDEAARVVIVANRNDPDSVELARFYAERRGIPRENIVALDLPAGEEIGWPEFVTRLHEPLRDWLIAHHWLEAIPMDLRDAVGRRKVAASGHRIAYLVTCRGVPLKIRRSDEVPSDAPVTARESFKTNQAAVDSELALLAQSETRLYGFVPNPIFNQAKPTVWDHDLVVRVARLDGPTYPAVRNLVESALQAERQGLIGRALVDVGGPYPRGDEWFEAAAAELVEAGWAPMVDRERQTLPATARADMVAIYLGWYAGGINGPFALPDFQFAPGAITLHLHSFSARSLRAMNAGGWSGPLVGRGAAATFGNVYEPYLELTHQPQLLVRALLGGATLGEAAYYAMPVLSWQSTVIGDPLYRPMAVDLATQWQQRAGLPGRLASYVALRHLAAAAEESGEALLAETAAALRDHPSLALAWEVGQRREAAGDRAGAVRELGIAAFLRTVRADEWGLLAAMAGQLAAWAAEAEAVQVWTTVLAQELPDDVRVTWLREAAAVARRSGDFTRATAWDSEITRLTPVPPPPAP